VSLSMFSKSGAIRQGAACGLFLFTQFWYWYPLIHCLSLSFTPTAVIGLNKDLKMPKNFSFESSIPKEDQKRGVKSSMFAYPAAEEAKKKEETVKQTAVLSAAKKGGAKSVTGGGDDSRKGSKKSQVKADDDKMDVDGEEKPKEDGADKKDGDKDKKDGEKEKELPPLMTLQNPSRVIPAQEKYIRYFGNNVDKNAEGEVVRYVPLLGQGRHSGFLLLTDKTPEEEEEFVDVVMQVDEDKEPEAPAEFTWDLAADE